MNERSHTAISLSIAAVERDTGLSKDTLRVWERRYGFPQPAREGTGERAYTLEEVEKLRLLKRLLDGGHRPGRIVPLPLEALRELADQTVDQPHRGGAEVAMGSAELNAHLALIRSHDADRLRHELQRLLARIGLGRFVIDVVGPLNVAVGDAWLRGQLEIFEEHLYTELLQSVLRQAIGAVPPGPATAAPRVLLATIPGEPHGMGLLMAEAVFRLEGCHCVSLGVQTPLWDIVLAAQALASDIVALSFTACVNPNQVVDALAELRAKLPAEVAIWAGGRAPVLHRRRVDGVHALATLDPVPSELQRWRAGRAASP